ncbi:MAG: hypothetical protein Q9227_002204 [Pyrenula ochraceoflavens]
MASVVISQVVSDIGHHAPSNMFGDGHVQTSRSNSSARPSVTQRDTSPESSSDSSTESTSPSQARPAVSTAPSIETSTPTPTNQPIIQERSAQGVETAKSASETVAQHPQHDDPSGVPPNHTSRGFASSPASPRLQPTFRSARSLGESAATSPSRIKVRDLSHIQSFASEEFLGAPRPAPRGSTRSFSDVGRQYEISAMPVSDIIEMVAGLLTKITTTNDHQHEHLHRRVPPTEESTPLGKHTQSVLAFHGKNVPSITILSYLSRIHKYCPTTYEVFLSLLVYFDRMTETVNRPFLESMQQRPVPQAPQDSPSPMVVDDPSIAPSHQEEASPSAEPQYPPGHAQSTTATSSPRSYAGDDAGNLAQFFVVDSYNIHRLVIAGVTCASKFFSDVFYTNSRYAKVGGLPLNELNHLEVQFLDLNNFRLAIPVEELEAYGTMLVEFYAREVLVQQQHFQQQHTQRLAKGQDWSDGVYMKGSAEHRPQAAQTPTPP